MTSQLGITPDPRYRTVDEGKILELLLPFGWAYEVRAGDGAAALCAAAEMLNRWVGLGLPYEQSPEGRRRFDPAEVMNFGKWASIQGREIFWEDKFVTNARRLICEFHTANGSVHTTPPPLTALGARRFAVTLEREFDLRDRQPGTHLRLRLPLPLEDDALRALRVNVIPPPEMAVEFTVAPGRLDARLNVPPTQMVNLAVQASFTAYPTLPGRKTGSLSDTEFELYTRPREGFIRISPLIGTLAVELATSAQGTLATVQRFWDFILDQMTLGIMHYDELDVFYPAEYVLHAGWYNCHLGSALLAALCRARHIPARLVSGYTLYSVCPSYHYWLEVWVDGQGWMPLDLSCADLSARGRDRYWRNYFVGSLDYRMKTQCLPRLFDWGPATRFPARWHMLQRAHPEGLETEFIATDTGALIFRDRISVYRGDAMLSEP